MAEFIAHLIGFFIPLIGIGFGVLAHMIAGYLADQLLDLKEVEHND